MGLLTGMLGPRMAGANLLQPERPQEDTQPSQGQGAQVMPAEVKEMLFSSPKEADAALAMLKEKGFQGYALQQTQKGETSVRYWPLNNPLPSLGPYPR